MDNIENPIVTNKENTIDSSIMHAEPSVASAEQYKNNQKPQTAPTTTKKNHTFWTIAVLIAIFWAGILAGQSMFSPKEEENSQAQRPVIEIDNSMSPVDKTPVQNVDTTVEDIVEDTLPALVSIQAVIQYTEDYLFFGPQTVTGESSGSGFIVQINEKEVCILTNAHVIEGAIEVNITFNNETQQKAIIKSCDTKADLALLSVDVTSLSAETVEEIKCVTLGDSDTLRLGQSVIAIGNALGYGQSVTTGVVSALNRVIIDEDGTEHTWIQTDAAINAGNSGGVLLDMNGRVIGVNEAKIADTGVEGMGFAIPITYALSTIDELSAVEANFPVAEAERGKLGISCVEIIETDSILYSLPQGIMIKEVLPDSGAKEAGILPNDVIVAINDKQTLTMTSLNSIMAYCAKGDVVKVTIMRNTNGQWTPNVIDVTLK